MRGHPKIAGVIPARFDSKRLPGKVLIKIGSKPMIQWVFERARQSALLHNLWVATDSEKVEQFCIGQGIPVIRTQEHPSGSDRLYEVMQKTDADFYLNIQADEPTVRPDHIELLVHPLLAGESEVTTLKVAISRIDAQDPNVVKVITNKHNRALYFSRLPIPFDRDGEGKTLHFKHIGLYGYTREALETFHGLPQSPLELSEKLEQLRFLENGIAVYVAETHYDTVGVDTPEDLERAAALLAAGV